MITEAKRNVFSSEKKISITILPTFLTLAIAEFTRIIIFLITIRVNHMWFYLFIFGQMFGSLILGFLSDVICRKIIMMLSLILGLAFLSMIFFFPFIPLLYLLFGIVFNPSPIARASLLDNFSNVNKVKLLSLSIIAQWGQWVFAVAISKFLSNQLVYFNAALLLFGFLAVWAFFYDKRDEKPNHSKPITLIHKDQKIKFYTTAIAFCITQIIIYLAASIIQVGLNTKIHYLDSFGALLGPAFAILYRRTPHFSVLSVSYGVLFYYMCIPLLSKYIFNYQDVNAVFQIAIVANVVFFYLPFVFDILLSTTNASFRGVICALLAAILSFSAICSFLLIKIAKITVDSSLILFPITFLIAVIIQKYAEGLHEKKGH